MTSMTTTTNEHTSSSTTFSSSETTEGLVVGPGPAAVGLSLGPGSGPGHDSVQDAVVALELALLKAQPRHHHSLGHQSLQPE